MKWFETEDRVRFNEVDESGIAWHGHFMAWFEVGRMALLKKFDLLPKQISDLGYLAPVINLKCDFKQPVFFGDPIIIRVRAHQPGTSTLVFQYEILRKKDQILMAKGETTQVLMTTKKEIVSSLQGKFEKRIRMLLDCFRNDRNGR